ncbi:MAG: 3-oxoacyl-ACP reductase family protein [Candidatus Gottesmanbacteria bacterium]|nr:3-oxoacyl-ACP reductase family protein [Candidatus Gottesmanbacteria bacterium]
MKLKDKVTIITGSSRGIGRATALLFAQEGAKVVINYIKEKKQAEEVEKIIGKNNCLLVQADVSTEEGVKKLVEETIKRFGRIDILVNNAGAIGERGWKTGIEAWRITLDVNLTSAWLMTKEVAPVMEKQDGGSIVNLASTVGMLGVAPILAYSCAKGGLVSMTKAFAKELAPKIRVNAVAPSNVMTDMTKSAGPDLIEFFRKETPLKRIAKPEELAKAILFLASDDSSYITGHTLVVDGGYSLK